VRGLPLLLVWVVDLQSCSWLPPFLRPRQDVLDGIQELVMELENMHIPIVRQAPLHIHANEVILTYGNSGTLVEFLKGARRKLKHNSFEVHMPLVIDVVRGNPRRSRILWPSVLCAGYRVRECSFVPWSCNSCCTVQHGNHGDRDQRRSSLRHDGAR